MRTVILVPRRADHGHRDRVWAACRRRWERLHPTWPIFEGHHDEGPFNRSAAINRAASEAGDWDIAVIIDSDVFLPPANVEAAVETATRTGRVTWAHRRWRGLSRLATDRLLERSVSLLEADLAPPDAAMERTTPISWSCCVAITREAWETIGGFDERFRGWGWEDMAFQALACGLVGHERIEGDVYHLWHPRSPGLGRSAPNADGVRSEMLGRRYMVALRRDHGLHDRPTPSDAAEMERDIANLKRDDARIARRARHHGLPDWSDWWPSLEELRDGKAAPRSVALVVHSGGEPAAWADRSVYLRRALASLDEHVRHPWERRVIFSDWGDCPELDAIAAEHGFTVAGSGRLGYTRSMQALWAYLRAEVRAEHVFLTEDDFQVDRDVDVEAMSGALADHPHLVQVALLRHPFYPPEMDPATILGHPRAAFEERANGAGSWLEHRLFFTANPSLIRRSLASHRWPLATHSEAVFGRQLFRHDKRARSAFWGSGEPWVTHIGEVRAGTVY